MLVKTACLLLAGLSFANAGIFQRQCYPSTVTVTAAASYAPEPAGTPPAQPSYITVTASPVASTGASASTVTSTVTETAFVTASTTTTTLTFTNFVTVQGSTSTVTQVVTGWSSQLSNAVASSLATNLVPSNTFKHDVMSFSEHHTHTPTTTMLVASTVFVVPVAETSLKPSTYSASVPAVPVTAPSSLAEPISTITVELTSTAYVTSIFTASSSFPTLTVTGSMGVTPSGASGAATAGSTGQGTGFHTSSSSGSAASTSIVQSSRSAQPPFINSTTQGVTTSSASVTSASATAFSSGVDGRQMRHANKRGIIDNKRQVGSIVTATIDGQIVTWTNTWAGASLTTSAAALPPQTSLLVVTATIDGVPVSWTETPLAGSPLPALSSTTNLGGPFTAGVPSPAMPTPSATSTSTLWQSSNGPSGPPGYSAPSHYTVPGWLSSEVPFPPQSPTTQPTSGLSTTIASFPAGPSSTFILTSSSATLTLGSSTIPASSSSQPGGGLSTTTASLSTGMNSSFSLTSSSAMSTISSSTSLVLSLISNSVTSTTGSSTTTASTFSASATCAGKFSGNFTINFDDLPRNGEPPSSDQYPPLMSPYEDLYWSQGFSYAPPPNDPYPPHSGSQLGVFVVDGNANVHSQNWTGPIPNDTDVNGMFGAGPNSGDPAFEIDAYGAWIGCQNEGPEDCQIEILGYGTASDWGVQAVQYFYQAPCTANCALQYVHFAPAFRNLGALQIQATKQGDGTNTALTWYVDDISLAWSNNSCEAVSERTKAGRFSTGGGFVRRWNEQTGRSEVSWKDRIPIPPAKKRG